MNEQYLVNVKDNGYIIQSLSRILTTNSYSLNHFGDILAVFKSFLHVVELNDFLSATNISTNHQSNKISSTQFMIPSPRTHYNVLTHASVVTRGCLLYDRRRPNAYDNYRAPPTYIRGVWWGSPNRILLSKTDSYQSRNLVLSFSQQRVNDDETIMIALYKSHFIAFYIIGE